MWYKIVPLLLAAVLLGCGSQKTDLSDYNVLLITLDTLRADFLSCYNRDSAARTPNLDSLAQTGALFERAFTTVPLTLPAHASLMTSRYPVQLGVRTNNRMGLDAEETTLAEIFQANGYATAAMISAFPVASIFGMNQGFDYYGEDFLHLSNPQFDMNLDNERSGSEVNKEAFRWLDKHRDRPFFLWLHYYDAHAPYIPPKEFAERYPAAPYAGEVAFVDSLVGEMVNRLRDLNLLKKTIIVICSDHGEGLGEHGENGHGLFIYNYAVHIPLIVYGPGVIKSQIIDRAASILDITPTLVGLLGLKNKARLEGEDLTPILLGGTPASETRRVYSESYYATEAFGWSALYSLTDGKWKFIKAPEPELYDLTTDLEEKKNLFTTHKQVVQHLEDELERLQDLQTEGSGEAKRAQVDESTVERLKSLGYIAGTGAGHLPKTAAIDPKNRIDVYKGYIAGLKNMREKNYEKAAEIFGEIANTENDNPVILSYLADAQIKLKQYNAAETVLEKILGIDPNFFFAVQSLAQIYERRKEDNKAIEILRQYIAKNPDTILYRYELWNLYVRLGQWEKAIAEMKLISEKHPEDVKLKLKIANTFLEHQRYRKALAAFEELKTSGLVLSEMQEGYAKALLFLGRFQDAEKAYRTVIREDPENYEAHLNLGMIYSQLKRFPEGVASCKRALELQPENPVIQFDYAYLLLLNDQIEEAKREFDKTLKMDPLNWKVHMVLGMWHKKNGRLEEALSEIGKALKLQPENEQFSKEVQELEVLISENRSEKHL